MAFPSASALSSFTGSDEDPLSEGGNWPGAIRWDDGLGTPANTLRRVSNAAGPSTAGTNAHCSRYWHTSYTSEQEVWATISAKPADGQRSELWGRVSNPGASGINGYVLEIDPAAGTDAWEVDRYIANSGTTMTVLTAREFSVGDKVGMAISGTGATVTIDVYLDSGSGWSLFQTVTDTNASRIVTGGYIGLATMQGGGGTGRFDDFGGGDIVSLTLDNCLPDADIVTTGWTTAPLYSKLNDASDASVITATAV